MFPGIFFGLLGTLVPLAIIILIGVIIISAARRRSTADDEPDPGIGSLRRFFYYGLALVALSVASSGIVILVAVILDSIFGDEVVITRGESRLALGLALTLVGAPIWGFIWMQIQKAVREQPFEARTFGRKLYVYIVMGITAAVAAAPLVMVLRWIMNLRDFSAITIAIPIVMFSVWFFHWKAHAADPPGRGIAPFVRPLYVYGTSLYGLAMFATGAGLVLFRYMVEAYDASFADPLVGSVAIDSWPRQVREGISLALVGSAWWVTHWFGFAKSDREPWIRQAYLNIMAVFGGTITVATSLTILIFGVLEWVFGAPGTEPASEHFRFIPGAVAGLIIGSALWGYHFAIIDAEAKQGNGWYFSARRGYEYLVAGVGLAILAASLITVIGVALGLIFPETGDMLTSVAWWKSPLAIGISLVIVGGVLWGGFWPKLQRAVAANPDEERDWLSRRVFIYGVFCISALTALADLSGLLFIFLRDLLEGNLNAETFQDTKWFIATLLTTAFISIYYGLILREDRRLRKATDLVEAPPIPPGRAKRVIVVGGPEGKEFARRLGEAVGQTVTFWQTLEGSPTSPSVTDYAALAGRIMQAPGERVLIVLEGETFRIVPYETDERASL